MNNYAIGIDVGGTNIRVALIDEMMNVLKKAVVRTATFKTFDDFIVGIRALIADVDQEKRATLIGMAVPAPWDDKMDYFRDATNVPFLENVATADIKRHFPNHTIFFENDVNVVALLESKTPARANLNSLMYITVSTGIGSGMIINGQLWQGANGYAGEVGNMIVSSGEADVIVVLEEVCSGLALDSVSKSLYGENATVKKLFEAYHQNDEITINAIESWLETMSDTMASLMHVINPQMFVLGGSVIYHNHWLLEEILRKTKPKLFENLREHLKIELSYYGEDSGVLGGAQLCFVQKKLNKKGD